MRTSATTMKTKSRIFWGTGSWDARSARSSPVILSYLSYPALSITGKPFSKKR
jgi:hypothetical protein